MASRSSTSKTCLMLQFIISHFFTFFFHIAISQPLPLSSLPVSIRENLRNDPEAIALTSVDYGNIVHEKPAAVLYPTSADDISALIKFAYENPSFPFDIAARGRGHSVRGQAFAENGIVVNMSSLVGFQNGSGIVVSGSQSLGYYADAGGEQLWIDVLTKTLEYGLAPVSWTDYLYLTVGGTLSNAGISGQAFRFGPQISNVHELDVITGKGEPVTCSPTTNSDLFYGVLGGLGQFGIITRARIPLQRAPTRVKWVRMLYTDFNTFTEDQELLISTNRNRKKNALNFVEGLLLLTMITNDSTSFFPVADQPRILSLINQYGIVYCLEVTKNYDDHSDDTINEVVERQLGRLRFLDGFKFEKDASYVEFLDRVHSDELALRALGLWDVPHPWFNMFVPKSRILDFNSGVFRDIVLKRNLTSGVILFYPMFRDKWDDRMSAVIPDEDIFYTVSLLFSSGFSDWESVDRDNKDILQFCADAGIPYKLYLPHFDTQEGWINHFGSKWPTFQKRKDQFDPRHLLSPGQGIFNTN